MKYSKNQQAYIDSLGYQASEAHPQALTIIGKQDMTIAMLLGALKMARLYLDHGYPITARIAMTGPMIGTVIDTAISDAEKGGMRVVDSSQFVEALLNARGKLIDWKTAIFHFSDEDYAASEFDDLMKRINDVLGIKEPDGTPNTEYQIIVYY